MNESEELLEMLDRQFKFLTWSCESYDSGNVDEAIRLAVTMRVLIYDTGSSTSFFNKLNVKDQINIESDFSETEINTNDIPEFPVDNTEDIKVIGVQYFNYTLSINGPVVDSRRINLEQWWQEQVPYGFLINNNEGAIEQPFRRGELICYIANKDGGAHVDHHFPNLEPRYLHLKGRLGENINRVFPWIRNWAGQLLKEEQVIKTKAAVLGIHREITSTSADTSE